MFTIFFFCNSKIEKREQEMSMFISKGKANLGKIERQRYITFFSITGMKGFSNWYLTLFYMTTMSLGFLVHFKGHPLRFFIHSRR